MQCYHLQYTMLPLSVQKPSWLIHLHTDNNGIYRGLYFNAKFNDFKWWASFKTILHYRNIQLYTEDQNWSNWF